MVPSDILPSVGCLQVIKHSEFKISIGGAVKFTPLAQSLSRSECANRTKVSTLQRSSGLNVVRDVGRIEGERQFNKSILFRQDVRVYSTMIKDPHSQSATPLTVPDVALRTVHTTRAP